VYLTILKYNKLTVNLLYFFIRRYGNGYRPNRISGSAIRDDRGYSKCQYVILWISLTKSGKCDIGKMGVTHSNG
jgi:hypothetical protein